MNWRAVFRFNFIGDCRFLIEESLLYQMMFCECILVFLIFFNDKVNKVLLLCKSLLF